MANQAKEEKKSQDFEKSLARLEQIVSEMEGGELGLEDMLKRFEEGQNLLAYCGKKLDEVERRIEVLVKKGEKVEAQPFESDSAPEAAEEKASEERQDATNELF